MMTNFENAKRLLKLQNKYEVYAGRDYDVRNITLHSMVLAWANIKYVTKSEMVQLYVYIHNILNPDKVGDK